VSRETVLQNQSSHRSSSAIECTGIAGSSTIQNCCKVSFMTVTALIVNDIRGNEVESLSESTIIQPRFVCIADGNPGVWILSVFGCKIIGYK